MYAQFEADVDRHGIRLSPTPGATGQYIPSQSHVPDSQTDPAHASQMLEEIMSRPGRDALPLLDPKSAMWFGRSGTEIPKTVRGFIVGLLKTVYPTYKAMPQADKDLWFRTFAMHYRWDAGITAKVREQFDHVAETQFSRYLYEWKKKWLKQNKRATSCPEILWEGLLHYWQLPETVRRSEIQKKNKKSDRNGKGAYVHNTGSMSFGTRERRMTEAAGGVRPNFLELMEACHTNVKTKEIQDPVVADIVENVKKKKSARLEELSQCSEEGSSSTVEVSREEINTWVVKATVETRGRCFGLGDLPSQSSSAEYSTSRVSLAEFEAQRQELELTRGELAETREEGRKNKEEIANLKDAVTRMEQIFNAQFARNQENQ